MGAPGHSIKSQQCLHGFSTVLLLLLLLQA
jgi:hypothetical protein